MDSPIIDAKYEVPLFQAARCQRWDIYNDGRFQSAEYLDTAPAYDEIQNGELYWLFPWPPHSRTYRAVCQNMARFYDSVDPSRIDLGKLTDEHPEHVDHEGVSLGRVAEIFFPGYDGGPLFFGDSGKDNHRTMGFIAAKHSVLTVPGRLLVPYENFAEALSDLPVISER